MHDRLIAWASLLARLVALRPHGPWLSFRLALCRTPPQPQRRSVDCCRVSPVARGIHCGVGDIMPTSRSTTPPHVESCDIIYLTCWCRRLLGLGSEDRRRQAGRSSRRRALRCLYASPARIDRRVVGRVPGQRETARVLRPSRVMCSHVAAASFPSDAAGRVPLALSGGDDLSSASDLSTNTYIP